MATNDELREAYTAHTKEVVDAVNADSVVDSLFAAKVLSVADYDWLSDISERKKKTRKLMVLLHSGTHPEAFVKLHDAIKTDDAYSWLAKQVDDFRVSSKGAAFDASKRVENVVQSTHVAISDDDRRPVAGVTSIGRRLCVLRSHSSRQEIQVYDTKSFKQQQTIQVHGLSDDTTFSGLTSCVTKNCLYVSDYHQHAVYKVELSANNKVSKWNVGRWPRGVSTNTACNLIVACYWPGAIQEYNATSGSLIREISLKSSDVEYPEHALQLTSDQFVVSCVNMTNKVYDVVELNTRGQVVVSYTNQLKSANKHEFNDPHHFTVDKNKEFILVADPHRNRIVILDRSWKSCARELEVTSLYGGLQGPSCLYFNVSQNRLIVGEWSSQCRVLMFDNVI